MANPLIRSRGDDLMSRFDLDGPREETSQMDQRPLSECGTCGHYGQPEPLKETRQCADALYTEINAEKNFQENCKGDQKIGTLIAFQGFSLVTRVGVTWHDIVNSVDTDKDE